MTASVLNKIQKLEKLKGMDIYYDNAELTIVPGKYNTFMSNKTTGSLYRFFTIQLLFLSLENGEYPGN